MKIAIGSDHGGIELKQTVADHLASRGLEVLDMGAYNSSATDYPDYALPVCKAILAKDADLGILICGTGIGMSMAANKVCGIRCALLGDVYSAKLTREHNDANVMSMGGRVIGPGLALEIVDAFIDTPFSGEERHARRIRKVMDLEKC